MHPRSYTRTRKTAANACVIQYESTANMKEELHVSISDRLVRIDSQGTEVHRITRPARFPLRSLRARFRRVLPEQLEGGLHPSGQCGRRGRTGRLGFSQFCADRDGIESKSVPSKRRERHLLAECGS